MGTAQWEKSSKNTTFEKNEVFVYTGYEITESSVQNWFKQTKNVYQSNYSTSRYSFERVLAIFRSKIDVFVMSKDRDLELNMCLHEAQINLRYRNKAPETVGILFYRPSHFIKTNFGICLAKNLNFFQM